MLLLVADRPYDQRVLQGLVIGALPVNFTVIGRKMLNLSGGVLSIHGCIVSESYPVLMQPTPYNSNLTGVRILNAAYFIRGLRSNL